MQRQKIVLMVLIAVLICIPIAYFGRLYIVFRRATGPTQPDPPDQPPPETDSTVQALTVLLLGIDIEDLEVPTSSARSDVIVLLRFDLVSLKVDLLSIPRDTLVEIPEHGMDKINHAFAFGGGPRRSTGAWLTRQTVANFLGLEGIDHTVVVDMNSVPKLVNALGGVEMDIEVKSDLFPSGHCTLDGEQALSFLRWRSDALGDIGRVARQQQFALAVMRELQRLEFGTELLDLIFYTLTEVRTDISLERALTLAAKFRGLTPDDVATHVIPGRYETRQGICYWIPDLAATESLVQEIFPSDQERQGGPQRVYTR
ncbi:MAG: LCP family protein [Bacillota bacterium]